MATDFLVLTKCSSCGGTGFADQSVGDATTGFCLRCMGAGKVRSWPRTSRESKHQKVVSDEPKSTNATTSRDSENLANRESESGD